MYRQLGEQLLDLARHATALAADNPGWIAPSQTLVANRLAECANVLQSQAEVILRQSHDD